jgi:hypothetical protein
MAIVLYTTDCPKCKVLEKKLEQSNISYTKNTDVDKMMVMGMKEAPLLTIDGVYYNFMDAVKWVDSKKG